MFVLAGKHRFRPVFRVPVDVGVGVMFKVYVRWELLGDDILLRPIRLRSTTLNKRKSSSWASPHRQQRLGAIQRLDLAFLIHTQHQSLIGWVQVQSDDIPNLFAEAGIFAELELSQTVRLKSVKLPDAI